MPSFTITGTSSTAQTLNIGERGIIGVNGLLYTTTDSITATGMPSSPSMV